MNANELRIGNYINERTSVLEASFGIIENCYFNPGIYNPIPLSTQRLEYFRFRKDSGYWYGKSIDKINSMLINYKTGSVVIIEKSGRNAISLCNVKYIHSLQNLWFALTGEELTKISKETNGN